MGGYLGVVGKDDWFSDLRSAIDVQPQIGYFATTSEGCFTNLLRA